jgi:thioredoxin 1
MADNIHATNDQNFDTDALQGDLPVLVDFWAEWCGPCRAIAPILEQLAADYADKVRIMKLNVDNSPQTPARYGVMGIPTLMLFSDGQLKARHVGSLSKAELQNFLDSNL